MTNILRAAGYRTPPHFFRKLLKYLTITIIMSACSKSPVASEVTINIDGPAIPTAIVNAMDGGYFMMVQSKAATLLKLDAQGHLEWKFQEPYLANVGVKITMAAALDDGGVIICGERNARYPSTTVLPGFLVRLNSHGQEVRRLDALRSGFSGEPFYQIMTCSPWGSSFIVSALETADATAGAFNIYTNRRVVISKLSSDLSIVWRKPLDVGGFAAPTKMPPVDLGTGNLIFPGEKKIFLIDPEGNELAVADTSAACRHVRPNKSSVGIQFSCYGGPFAEATILTFDLNLKLVDTTPLQGAVAFPITVRLTDGNYMATFNRANPAGPQINVYASTGKLISEQAISSGMLQDAIALSGANGALILRVVDENENLYPNIAWIKR